MGESSIEDNIRINSIIYYYKRMITLVSRRNFKLIGIQIFLKLIIGTFPILQLYLTVKLVDAITIVIDDGSAYIFNVYLILLFQLFVIVGNNLVTTLSQFVDFKIETLLSYEHETLIIKKCAKLPLDFFDVSENYNFIERASEDNKVSILINAPLSILQNLLTLIGYILVLFNVHYTLAIVMILLSLPIYIINAKVGKLTYGQMVTQTNNLRKLEYLYSILKRRSYAKEIRLFGISNFLLNKWIHISDKTINEQLNLQKYTLRKLFNLDLFISIFTILITGVIIFFTSLGKVTIGGYVALSQALLSSQGNIESISKNLASIYESTFYIRRLIQFIDYKEEKKPTKALPFPSPLSHQIEFSNVTFKYANNFNNVLNNISFKVKAGQKIAIVGENGSGKTTLIKILMGLYLPTKGSVFYDGVSIFEINQNDIRKNVTGIFQDFIKYHFLLRENIAIGDLSSINNDNELISALNKSDGSMSILKNFTDGLDTQLGPEFESGHEPSGGQWQKIALARAFLRDSNVIILDEPTASVDPLAELDIFNKCIEATKEKTTFFISHRLGICKYVDTILVLKDGKLIDEGTHETLMKKQGEYERMFNSQAKWYK